MYNNNNTTSDNLMLIKHSGAINISNNLNATQRKGWNALLYRAFPNLSTTREYECLLSDIRIDSGYKNKNLNDFKQLIRDMQGMIVEGDLFNKSDEDWRSTQILGDVAFTRNGMIRWSYSESLRTLLANPKVYARLNMIIQRELNGKFAIPLWECLVDQLGSRRVSATVKLTVELARKIFPVAKNQYKQFKDFKRYVIEKAVDEINKSSDIEIKEVRYKRAGRSIGEIHFDVIRRKTELITSSPITENISITERLEKEFGFNKKQIEEVIKTTKDSHPGDYETYLIKAMDYVHIKNKSNGVESTVGAYLSGVLKNGFNTGGELDKPRQEKEAEEHNEKKQLIAFHKHRQNIMLEIYSRLSKKEKDKLISDFYNQASATDKVSINAGGFENKDQHLLRAFNHYKLKTLLTRPVDTDINVFTNETDL